MNTDLGLLVLRVTTGLMMAIAHGWGKFLKVVTGDFAFADPIGIGQAPSLILTAGAEFICAILLALGVKTRWMAVPLAFAMFVAAFVHHLDDPWQKKEFALLYAIPFVVLAITGGGRYSLDKMWSRK